MNRPLPGGQQRLDAEWAAGKWDFLKSRDHFPRLGVVASYCDARGKSLLEVGCGEGLLRDRLLRCERYVGVDVSAEAIARATERAGVGTRFVQADASGYIPGESFDVIAFTDCLEWFADPLGLLEHYQQYLNNVYVVSMFDDRQSRKVWRLLGKGYAYSDRSVITNADGDCWDVRVLSRK